MAKTDKKNRDKNKKPVQKGPKFRALNSREMKPILLFLQDHFGYTKKFEYALILTAKDKLYAVRKEVFDLPVEELKVNSFGLYFAEWRNDQVRFSIEGSQIIGPDCTKNIIELPREDLNTWMKGENLPRTPAMKAEGSVLVKCGRDYLGGGKLGEEILYNFVPKNRRIRFKV